MNRIKSSTCIAAIRNSKGKIVMAADRRQSWGYHQAQKMPNPKVVKRDGLLLAGCGDGSICDLIVNYMYIPEDKFYDPGKYMYETFHEKTVKYLMSKGFKDDKGNLSIPGDMEAGILVAYKGRLFEMDINNPVEDRDQFGGLISINEIDTPYGTGCGGSLAWGALKALQQSTNMSAKDMLKTALTIASEISIGCGDGIDVVSE